MRNRAARNNKSQNRRSTFLICVDEQTCSDGTKRFDSQNMEFSLTHKISDKDEAADRRSAAMAKRRDIMQCWADYATGVSNVVTLREVA